ncbi:hypothetical protein A9200_05260 [Maribacter hydrothermalis]|uniref:Adhesin domain-containing protein n=2 Tax=Maribacter hydrothermalis TaxID=1836467 RepID=A0A1B7Z933_9FLAO|nr:hypothetical protein BTR34_17015 [Maribacter hydrothermalis]OBR39070.1 hypothetical protein A9200_05260 [Maribacter hydrothermalis]
MVVGFTAIAQEKVSKETTKTYPFNNTGELHLENKYGNINIYGWTKEEVSITINITVTDKKKEDANDLLKRINPAIRRSDKFISVNYEISEKNSGFFSNLFEKANPFDFDRSNIQIDYIVYLPKKVELEIVNKFGDVFIEDWVGILKADVQHGDMWMNDNLNKADINIKYGKLRAKNINYANLDISNGGLDMDHANTIRLNSNGSNIDVLQAESLELYSNKDELEINEIGTLYGNLKFSKLRIHQLKKDVDLNLKISDILIESITTASSRINLEQESSEVSINILHFPHDFSAVLEEGLVRLPKSFHDVDSKMLDKGKKLREIKAVYGKNGEGRISISGSKGVVLLKEL